MQYSDFDYSVADLRQVFQTSRLQPGLAPQPVALKPDIVLGDVGIDPDGDGGFELVGTFDDVCDISHAFLLLLAQRDRQCLP